MAWCFWNRDVKLKLRTTEKILRKIAWCCLLANAHANRFCFHNQWENFLFYMGDTIFWVRFSSHWILNLPAWIFHFLAKILWIKAFEIQFVFKIPRKSPISSIMKKIRVKSQMNSLEEAWVMDIFKNFLNCQYSEKQITKFLRPWVFSYYSYI